MDSQIYIDHLLNELEILTLTKLYLIQCEKKGDPHPDELNKVRDQWNDYREEYSLAIEDSERFINPLIEDKMYELESYSNSINGKVEQINQVKQIIILAAEVIVLFA
ncbi:hypothetical protein [Acinetobacter calcoaceticus]|uniref:hypothetical protein n=1 Tax=Acinetobacter calcoaceticus TaxID=471 RepID=UPI00124CA9FC|nr:hypothetical protein [Acinetobacter calcoaceticus]